MIRGLVAQARLSGAQATNWVGTPNVYDMKHRSASLEIPSVMLVLPETLTVTHNPSLTMTTSLGDPTISPDTGDGTETLVPKMTLTFSNVIDQ